MASNCDLLDGILKFTYVKEMANGEWNAKMPLFTLG